MKAWRKIERTLPQEETPVLVHTTRGLPFVAVYYDEQWHCYHTNERLNVIYWMPIPLTPDE
jgi:hypothetical protein